jgi:hypothetical protein
VTSEADLQFNGAAATDVAGVDSLLSAMLAHYVAIGGDQGFGVWITSPANAVAFSVLRAGARGPQAFVGVGAMGGQLTGVPLLTSKGAPADSLTLLDGSGLMLADCGETTLAVSEAAMIDMDDAPTGTNLVSVFGADAVALKIVRVLNWKLVRPAVCFATNFTLPAANVDTTT